MRPRAHIARVVAFAAEAARPANRACPRTSRLGDSPKPLPDWALLGQPEPDVEFDQRVSWQPPSSATEDTAAPDLTPARCACNLLPNPRQSAFRHLRDLRAALG